MPWNRPDENFLSARIVEYVSEYTILIKKNVKKNRQKAEETKEEKIISVENLTGYDDIISKFSGYF